MSYEQKTWYENLWNCLKSNRVSYGLGLTFILTFIAVAAVFQGLPAMFEAGTEEESEKYKLYFNYLCPQLRHLLLGDGNTPNQSRFFCRWQLGIRWYGSRRVKRSYKKGSFGARNQRYGTLSESGLSCYGIRTGCVFNC